MFINLLIYIYYLLRDFTRIGAKFSVADQKRYTEIMVIFNTLFTRFSVITQRYNLHQQKLAELTTKFTQNIIADESELFIELTKDDLTGLPLFLQKAAQQASIERQLPNGYVITLSRSLVVPFLTFSDRRDLREKAWRMWTRRGELVETRDNLQIAKEILILRSEQVSTQYMM